MNKKELTAAKIKFGQNLKAIREGKNMSLLDVSYNCSLDDSHISKIEQGEFNLTLGTMLELAKGLEIHPSELLQF
jgi:transcriptional regulator with XRE-family HTH domain